MAELLSSRQADRKQACSRYGRLLILLERALNHSAREKDKEKNHKQVFLFRLQELLFRRLIRLSRLAMAAKLVAGSGLGSPFPDAPGARKLE